MNDISDIIEMISFPYYAHLQAQIVNPLQSISWNKVALVGYIDILLYTKNLIPPAGFQRKIRMLYENYQNLDKNYPALGDLDSLFRSLSRLDKDQPEQVKAMALKWHLTVQVIEKICLEMAAHRSNFSDPLTLSETIQTYLFQTQNEAVPPKLNDYLDEQQEEIRRLAQLKKYPLTVLQKIKLRHQFSGFIQTDKQPVQFLIKEDPEIQDLINNLNKTFFRLINQINQKLPEPDRSLKTDPSRQDLSAPQDYRLALSFTYDGNEGNEYETGLFSRLRNLLR